jgi:hypothetical protein
MSDGGRRQPVAHTPRVGQKCIDAPKTSAGAPLELHTREEEQDRAMASQASNPSLSQPDNVELVEDPRLAARRARLRRVFYAIVGPAAIGTILLLVIHVVRKPHAVVPTVTHQAAVTDVAPAAAPELVAPSVASVALAAAAPSAEPAAAAAPSAEAAPSARAAPARVHGAARPPSTGPKAKRAWAWKAGTR